MLTKEQFEKKWHKYGKKGRKFIIRYIENGLDPQEAAVYAGYQGRLLINTHRMLRRYNEVINYLLEKNNIVDTLCKPTWIISEYQKLYNNTQSEITKINILNQLSKIRSMINTHPQVNVENNIPSTPVIIRFEKEDK